jgi:GNAT superfamily N-acetyltransferase
MGQEPIAESSILIRPPTPAERRACRMLLPRATSAGQKSQLHVAVAGADGRLVGAAALGPDLGLDTGPAEAGRPRLRWLVDLRVIVPCRRRGIGRALMRRVVEQATAHGIPALYAWEYVEPDGDAARAWAALGFSPCQRRLEFEADIAQARATIMPFYDRALEDGWIPPTARIVPLADADAGAVADLHVRYLGGTRRLLMPLLRGAAPEAFDPTCSRVLTLDGQVVGFTLGRVHADGVCDIDSNVIHPAVRLGWANLWLKYEAASVLLAKGVHTIRYFSLQQHTDTRRVSRQVGARLLRTLVQMRLDLTAPASPTGGGGGAAE